MRDLLGQKGYRLGHELRYEEEEEASHNEAAWARRLPGALRFLLARYRQPVPEPTELVLATEPTEHWWEF
jgi:hypothetical protein